MKLNVLILFVNILNKKLIKCWYLKLFGYIKIAIFVLINESLLNLCI